VRHPFSSIICECAAHFKHHSRVRHPFPSITSQHRYSRFTSACLQRHAERCHSSVSDDRSSAPLSGANRGNEGGLPHLVGLVHHTPERNHKRKRIVANLPGGSALCPRLLQKAAFSAAPGNDAPPLQPAAGTASSSPASASMCMCR
jgi:hypothetical protein